MLAQDQGQQRAEQTLLLLSPMSLQDGMIQAQWATALTRDPTGARRSLLPIRIEECEVSGLLAGLVPIDLVGLNEAEANARLLDGVKDGHARLPQALFPGQALPHAHAVFPGTRIWNIPFASNAYFTGRKEQLDEIYTRLQQHSAAAISQPQTISGLGGIGKTQLAIEYAYRHRQEYPVVFWARAETSEALIGSYSELASLLNLPEKNEHEQALVVQAVRDWLRTQREYLLILDNADDPAILPAFVPPDAAGHLLITTRAADLSSLRLSLGLAHPLRLTTFTPEQGAHLLLLCAELLEQVTPQEVELAAQISRELDGLALALDQAGSYILASGINLADYLALFCQRRADLLQQPASSLYPTSVAATWSLSLQRVAERNPAAADLLRFCAFLAPDAIPEAIITKGVAELGPLLAPIAADPLSLNSAIADLRAYSLIERDPRTHTLSVHRLIQATLQDSLPTELQQTWKRRTILAVEAAYPGHEFAAWPLLERWLPHAQICATWIEQVAFVSVKAAQLLNQAGYYLRDRGRYAEAEPLYQQALAINEQELGTNHPRTATSLNNLAELYKAQERYAEAEPLYKPALAINEQALGASHPQTAISLNNLAELYYKQGRYAEAEPLCKRALAINEQELGANHPQAAGSLSTLAALYRAQGRYAKAEPLYERALDIYEQELGTSHPLTATGLNNLAELYCAQGRYAEAEPLYERALAINEQALGASHSQTAIGLNNLAEFYKAQSRYAEAEPLYERALAINEQALGASHPQTAGSLNNLAELYHAQGRYAEAEPLYQRALRISEQSLGRKHPWTRQISRNYAALLRKMGKQKRTWWRDFLG